MRYITEILNTWDERQIREYQTLKLREQLSYCYAHSEFYHHKLKEVGAYPFDTLTIDDFRKLPVLMTKKEERRIQNESLQRFGHPFGLHLCAPIEDIALVGSTSGTTGQPTFTYTFSKRELNGRIADLWAFIFHYVGVQPGERVLFAYALSVSSTSMILWGIRRARAIPIEVDVSIGADKILQFAQMTNPSCAMMTPSLAKFLATISSDSIGCDIGELGIKSLLLCGEPGVSDLKTKKRLESAYNARVYDFWAPGGLGFGLSCDSDRYYGLHCYAPDFNLYQDDVVDPVSKVPLEIKDGTTGELIHTSLDRDACPVVRYAYGDIARVRTKECPGCGFKGKRLEFLGRSDDMMLVKGNNLYPTAIQAAITRFVPCVTGAIKIILEGPLPVVDPPIKLKLSYGVKTYQRQLPRLEMQIIEHLYNEFGVIFEVCWVPAHTLASPYTKTSFYEIRQAE